MDYRSAQVQPPVSEHTDEIKLNMVLMDSYSCASALVLFVTFFIVVTRFRLWHTNKFLMNILAVVNNPVNNWISQAITIVLAYENNINDLYLIWVVILIIAFDNVFTISCYSLLEKGSDRRSREIAFLSNCITAGVLIIINKQGNEFYGPLLALWSLVVAKFFIRIASYMRGERAYGLENVDLVAEYMKSEHELTRQSEVYPTSMKGYKYLVMGEEKIGFNIEAPDYSPKVELTAGVVTVERVWNCKEGLLHPSVDTDGRLKDVCLSFALFKLLRRPNFGYPAAEAPQAKTSKLIFDGLLSANVDKERVFRVIKLELGFLRDLIFTRYPVAFAFGSLVLSLVSLHGMLCATLLIAIKAFYVKKNNAYNIYLFWSNKVNVDYPLTNSLLILIIVMELFEVLTYVLSDWTKVIIICGNVKRNFSIVTSERTSSNANSNEAQPRLFGYQVLAFFCKPRFFLSVKNKLGQYSLLENCKKTDLRSSRQWFSLISTCEVSKIPQLKKGKAVKLRPEVKEAIFDTLVKSRDHLTNGRAALQRNGASVCEDLKWTLNLTLVHTIMVWHIATSLCLCAIPLENVRGNKDHMVATHLSNYCAYLVAFLPDLLPLTSCRVKSMFGKIVEETSEFFDKEHTLEAMYKKVMSPEKEDKDHGQKIINRGSELGRYLIEKIPGDAQRWKLMADFWSELILYLAPSGSIRVHFEELGNGSEFITHLWALLYHAGIIDTTSAENHPLEVA